MRSRPYRRIEIDEEICAKIEQLKARKRYRGSFTSLVESILDDYVDGVLGDSRGDQVVVATRVRSLEGSKGEGRRKIS